MTTNRCVSGGRMPRTDLAPNVEVRNKEHGTEIYLLIGEPEAAALVAGFVPHTVRQQARAAIDWEGWAKSRRSAGVAVELFTVGGGGGGGRGSSNGRRPRKRRKS